MQLPENTALVVVDAQVGFDDPWWGPRDNPDCDANIAALADAFVGSGRPVVYVRHESENPDSPLHPGRPGNALKPYLARHRPDLVVTKSVNSSFHGDPDLDAWLRGRDVGTIVVVGITTNHCCETTARVGGNLGYDVWFALDATHTFDRTGPDGTTMTAEELARATATNLHGEFATVVTSAQVVRALGGAAIGRL
ncbi:cysteine hydrolase family protein [Nocardioides panaciterrulae]|uniref:Nicotinamidase-related amidase n=1 Tax=Nocardioides panaciterrulae TaxID=661492 RepID=A0A7Y9JBQ5_9ACTN|nr:cysteine hydrolase family protein [Nocardioides panaciterrulae]NYD42608.1 nicotinamidase-related amidase [Nocardioides panaciterrulae]